jgi:hypothetical protein
MVAEREPALPRLRNACAANVAQQLGRVLVRDRDDRNTRHRHLPGVDPPSATNARVTGRARIAGTVHDAPTLHAARRAHRPFGINVAAYVAVVLRVAVDQQRDRPVPLGLARLDPAE